MVKVNRFVLVKSTGGLPFQGILQIAFVPVVVMNKSCTSHFQGYAMKVTLFSSLELKGDCNHGSLSVALDSVMMLAQNLDFLCDGFMQADSDRLQDDNGNMVNGIG